MNGANTSGTKNSEMTRPLASALNPFDALKTVENDDELCANGGMSNSANKIYAMPVFDMIETVLVKKLNFTPSFMLRFITRNIYVATTMFIGICFPFFGGLLGFFGGFAFAPTTYFLPCVMWLSIHKPKRWSLSWICNWICIFFGVALMVLSPIGGLRSIIVQAKDYKFFSNDSNSRYKQVDNRTEKEKAIDAWLPITSSRNAKWWYSAFHNVTAMVGAGVLSLPYAMSELGWSVPSKYRNYFLK
ncbi:lysine histidine transporter 1 [Artemisia annua]|uniref:Lysine histidine transporter 1 n=1 Tax=Artemisia annua TaxID=35608 RepID=A0A2U1LAK3_ARTAN|nr:lysine histidine transporter 1 [Artemisia annua]